MRRLLPALLLCAATLLACTNTATGSASRGASVEGPLDETTSACSYLPSDLVNTAFPDAGFGSTPPGEPKECVFYGDDRMLTLTISFDATADGTTRQEYSDERFGTVEAWQQLGKTRPERVPVLGLGEPAVMWSDVGTDSDLSFVLVEWFHSAACLQLGYSFTTGSSTPDTESRALVELATRIRADLPS